MTPGALSCRQDRSPPSRRRSQWNPGKNITSRKVHLQLKNTERAVACAALRTAFQNMDPEKEVFLSSEQTVLISFTEQLPDPFVDLKSGWKKEEEGMQHWPPTMYGDMAEYLVANGEVQLQKRLMGDYKDGKAFSLGSTCNHVAGVLFKMDHAWATGVTNKSCTSKPAEWTKPRKNANTDARKIKDME
ncbi:hypothetical protein Bbelb_283380 [Branchiostoma belcheri]|nr:hypothetical protein Bbelb_283380 [Branchiostoma belcheri]